MSFKLTFLSVFLVLSISWFSNAKTVFPAPATPSGPHSQCGLWRASLGFDQVIQSSTANLLTSKQTHSLKSLNQNSLRQRGIDPSEPTEKIVDEAGAPGACGSSYDSDDNVVCLWNGSGSEQPASRDPTPGWVTGSSTNNCYRSIWVKANGHLSRGVLAESCAIFDLGVKVDVQTGCSAIFISANMFTELGYNKEVGSIKIDSWDFDSPEKAW
ncbi:secreted protein [Melampsora americana]|nr:secreted protein [Melampsora americana]